jgi:hypothetical protein
MQQQANLRAVYASALRTMRKADRRNSDQRGAEPSPLPEANPFTLDDLLEADPDDLLR